MKKFIPIFAMLVLSVSCAGNASQDRHAVKSDTCKTAADCGPSRFCMKKDGACDSEGQCADKPEICTMIYDPVCGCDNKTYSSACTAHGSGVNVQYKGECKQD